MSGVEDFQRRVAAATGASEDRKMPDSTLFHNTPMENKEAILRDGLLVAKSVAIEAGIFLTNVRPLGHDNFVVFEIDARGLNLEEDWTTEPPEEGEKWFVAYDDIPPSRIVAADLGLDRKMPANSRANARLWTAAIDELAGNQTEVQANTTRSRVGL